MGLSSPFKRAYCSMSLLRTINLFIALAVFTFIATFGLYNLNGQSSECSYRKDVEPNITQTRNITNESNQEQVTNRCGEVDYDRVLQLNNHTLPVRTWTYNQHDGICEGEDEQNCLPKLKNVKHGQYFWLSKPAKIVGCSIKKNMSQLMQAILCFLHDELKFLYSGKDLVRDVFKRGCQEQRYNTLQEAIRHRETTKSMGYSYMAIVRDPVDRLLSGFLYMCVSAEHIRGGCSRHCFGCEQNLTCYVEKQYKKIREMAKDTNKRQDPPTEHSYPQSWRCDFKHHLKDYDILHYKLDSEEFYPILRSYLQTRNVSKRALDYIKVKMTSLRTSHSTSSSRIRPFLEERLRSSSYLMEMVMRLYYHDYKIFGLELPGIPST
ncbi:hypothetical protein M3Y95_01021000 [Aphelenchoides besseyi]|nr:hypothetical protein M3Y95_01021000 [Aphelenchoides besseyi]